MSQSKIYIRLSLLSTDWISPTRGLRQGDPLSPILYNIVFDVFLRTILSKITGSTTKGQPHLKIAAFADSCAVVVSSKTDVIKPGFYIKTI